MTDPKILYRRYLLARLGADGDPLDLRGHDNDELAAHALGEHGRGGPILSAAQVAEEVAALMPQQAEAPEAPATDGK